MTNKYFFSVFILFSDMDYQIRTANLRMHKLFSLAVLFAVLAAMLFILCVCVCVFTWYAL